MTSTNTRSSATTLYIVDPIAIIEVRREEVLASTLDGGRLWRWGPRVPRVSELC
jgi:hypothetical protein